jgi:archaellum biogenesis protein FlaJ (TadC family)
VGKKRAIQRAARLARCRREEQTSDAASVVAGNVSAREEMSDLASRVANVLSAGERNERFSERCGGQGMVKRSK